MIEVLRIDPTKVYYLVSLDGSQAPKKHHADVTRAFAEAARLADRYKRPARVLMQVGAVFPAKPQPTGPMAIVANFVNGLWSKQPLPLEKIT